MAATLPRMARLFASVPPEVKRQKCSLACSDERMASRHAARRFSACTAGAYSEEGLKYPSRMHCAMASTTASAGRVVALLSK